MRIHLSLRNLFRALLMLLVSAIAQAVPVPHGLWQLDNNLANERPGGAALVAQSFSASYVSDSLFGYPQVSLNAPSLASSNQRLVMPTPGGGNGGGSFINNYSIVCDLKVPALPVSGAFMALLQTDTTNANDAELFINSSGQIYVSGAANTLTPTAVVTANQWVRLAFTCGNSTSGGQKTMRGYLNGVQVYQSAPQALDGRYSLNPTALLFADQNGETAAVQCNSIGFWREALTAQDLTALGGPRAVGLLGSYVVGNANASGAGSFVAAMTAAASSTGEVNIAFAPGLSGQTITLASQIVIGPNKNLSIDASNLARNVTIDGGPGPDRIFRVETNTTVDMSGLTLSGGNGYPDKNIRGGAIYNDGTLTMTDCNIINNRTSEGFGGGILNNRNLTLNRCTIANNTASLGGGGVNNFSSTAVLVATNCTFYGNRSLTQSGGGLANRDNAVSSLTHCTFTENEALTSGQSGGGIVRSAGTVTMNHCIVAGNSAPTSPNLSGTIVTPSGDTNLTSGDARLGTLDDYNGRTLSVPLLPMSPAINAANSSTMTIDQLGLSRMNYGAYPDLGAVEFGRGLGSTELTVGPAAGTNSVLLSADFPWTAVSNDSWLQIQAGSQTGTVGKAVVFTYTENTDATRTGTLTIAGRTVTVTQAGSTYVAANPLTTLFSTDFNLSSGVAVDDAGNVYFADESNSALMKWTAATNSVTTLVQNDDLSFPRSLAVDAEGNVYIAVVKIGPPPAGYKAIKKWTAATSSLTDLPINDLYNPLSIAVDEVGNLYIADSGNDAIKKWTVATGLVSVLPIAGLTSVTGIEVDNAGDLYFIGGISNSLGVWKWRETTPSVAPNRLFSEIVPLGISVDGSGNVYYSRQIYTGNNETSYALKKWTAATNEFTTLIDSGSNYLSGVAVDGAGNVFITDLLNDSIKQITYAFVNPQPLSFDPDLLTPRSASAGSFLLPPVLPASVNLSSPFTPTSPQPWLTFTHLGNGALQGNYANNTDPFPRIGVFSVLGVEQPALNQSAPTYTLASTGRSVPGTAGSQSVGLEVSHTFGQWTATSNAAWLTITSSASGSGSATINFSVAANNTTGSRTGSLTIAGKSFTVQQDVASFNIVATQAAYGTISPAGATTVTYGSNSSAYMIAPNAGYYLDTLIVDGASVSPANSYTFDNVTGNHTITAIFAALQSVSSTSDSGPGSLRDTLARAGSGSTIAFDPALSGQTITLSSQLHIDKDVTIDASSLANGLTISGNNATRVFDIHVDTIVTMRSLSIVNGKAPDGASSGQKGENGGGIRNAGVLELFSCTIAGNAAGNGYRPPLPHAPPIVGGIPGGSGGGGGGIFSSGSLALTSCTVAGNNAGTGGTTLNNGGKGGGIECLGLQLIATTVSGNRAEVGFTSGRNGGGISSSIANLQNSIVALNYTGTSLLDDVVVSSGINYLGANLLGSAAALPLFVGSSSGPAPLIAANPLLAPLGNYGGPTQTMALLPGSPARNAAVGSTLSTDQRGFPIVGIPDIGAYEAGSTTNYNAWICETLAANSTSMQRASTFDFDGDGQTNSSEWAALTDPGNPGQFFRVVQSTVSSSTFNITFPTALGRSYQIQSSPNLANSWTNIGSAIPGTGSDVTVPMTLPGNPSSFFRVRVGLP